MVVIARRRSLRYLLGALLAARPIGMSAAEMGRPAPLFPVELSDAQFKLLVGPVLERMERDQVFRLKLARQMARYLGRRRWVRLMLASTSDLQPLGRLARRLLVRRLHGCFSRLS